MVSYDIKYQNVSGYDPIGIETPIRDPLFEGNKSSNYNYEDDPGFENSKE